MHCGTNGLKTEKDYGKIADNIQGLAHQSKTNYKTVMISRIVPQNDNLNDYATLRIKSWEKHVVRETLDS